MAVRLIDVNVSNNRLGGIMIVNQDDVYINGLTANNNGGDGLVIINKDSIYETLGLPQDVSTDILRRVLTEIVGGQTGATAEEVVRRSDLFGVIKSAGLDLTAFMANITTLAANPNIQGIIASLGS